MNTFVIETRHLDLFYGDFQALTDINLNIEEKKITALIGPSGCGKSTLVRVFNRMNDLIDGVRTTGDVNVLGDNIFTPESILLYFRQKVGMVFQRPNPFPLSVRENITFGLEIHNKHEKNQHNAIVEAILERRHALGRSERPPG